MTFDRNYVLGDIDLSGGTTNPAKIYGKPSSTSENLTEVANQLKSDINLKRVFPGKPLTIGLKINLIQKTILINLLCI